MLAIAAIAGVLAITPPPYLPIVVFFFAVTTAVAAILRRATGSGWLAAYTWVVVLYPLIAIALVYLLWFVIWSRGGMPPGAHPRDDGGLVGSAYVAARFGLLGLGAAVCVAPPFMVMCIGAWSVNATHAPGRGMVLILAGIAAWILLVGLFLNDATWTFRWFLA